MVRQVLSRLEIPKIWPRWIGVVFQSVYGLIRCINWCNDFNPCHLIHGCIYLRISIKLFTWQPLKSIILTASPGNKHIFPAKVLWWRCKVSHLPWDIYPFQRVLTTLLDQPWISGFPLILPYQLSTLMNATCDPGIEVEKTHSSSKWSFLLFWKVSLNQTEGGGLLWFIRQ